MTTDPPGAGVVAPGMGEPEDAGRSGTIWPPQATSASTDGRARAQAKVSDFMLRPKATPVPVACRDKIGVFALWPVPNRVTGRQSRLGLSAPKPDAPQPDAPPARRPRTRTPHSTRSTRSTPPSSASCTLCVVDPLTNVVSNPPPFASFCGAPHNASLGTPPSASMRTRSRAKAVSRVSHVGSRLPRVAHVVPDGRKWRGSAQGA